MLASCFQLPQSWVVEGEREMARISVAPPRRRQCEVVLSKSGMVMLAAASAMERAEVIVAEADWLAVLSLGGSRFAGRLWKGSVAEEKR